MIILSTFYLKYTERLRKLKNYIGFWNFNLQILEDKLGLDNLEKKKFYYNILSSKFIHKHF